MLIGHTRESKKRTCNLHQKFHKERIQTIQIYGIPCHIELGTSQSCQCRMGSKSVCMFKPDEYI